MTTLVVDIETINGGTPEQQEAIAEMAAAREMDPAAFAALCPPLARVVCVGLKALESGKAIAYAALLPDGERHVLEQTNAAISKATRLVTFSGRTFDLPVLIHRSLINGMPRALEVSDRIQQLLYAMPRPDPTVVASFRRAQLEGFQLALAYTFAWGQDISAEEHAEWMEKLAEAPSKAFVPAAGNARRS